MQVIIVSLLIASVVSTIVWALQNSIKPLTKKFFSQTWHYYTGLIPVFFLLGGSDLIIRFVPWLRSASSYLAVSPEPMRMFQESAPGVLIGEAENHYSFIEQLFSSLLQIRYLNEILEVATTTWAIGAVVFLLLNIYKFWVFKRSLLQGSWVSETVNYPVRVSISPGATTPMVIGVWKPIIILPDTKIGEKELSMIMSHELVHLRRGDLIVKFVVLIANAVHWFNPIAYILNRQINTLCELSCDEQVVRKMDMENRRLYGETLLSMLEYSVRQKNVAFTSSLCSPKTEMKRRLLNLMNQKKMKKKAMMLSVISAIALVVSGGTAAYAAGSNIPTGKQTDGRNIYIQSADGTVLHYDKDGKVTNVTMQKPKKTKQFDEKTQKRIDALHVKIEEYLSQGLSVPKKVTDEFTAEELAAALNGISGYVYDEQGVRPYKFTNQE